MDDKGVPSNWKYRNLQWAQDVVKDPNGRQIQESPLKRWWLEQQALKGQQEGAKIDDSEKI